MLLAAAQANDDGFETVRQTGDCSISMRPESHPSGAAMRAICDWPEVDPVHLADLLGDYPRYAEYIFPIAECRIERAEDERILLYQRQELFAISDREVLLWMERTKRETGTRFAWTAAAELPLTLRRGAVRTPRNDGFWDVETSESGGSRVVHEIAMDAGGSIPRWIVNLVRTRSFARIMADVRAIAGTDGEADARSARTP